MELRARVTFAWGAWWYRLQAVPGFVEYAGPYCYPTAAMAADAARYDLARRAETDPLRRAMANLVRISTPWHP